MPIYASATFEVADAAELAGFLAKYPATRQLELLQPDMLGILRGKRVGRDEFPLTQEFLAQMLGVRRPTVNIAGATLQRAGFIRYTRGRITVEQWIDVITTAHSLGIRTTSTIMFGHVETPEHWVRHLDLIRRIQQDTKFPVYVAEDPLTSVVKGCGEALEEASVWLRAGDQTTPPINSPISSPLITIYQLPPLSVIIKSCFPPSSKPCVSANGQKTASSSSP